MKSFWCICIRIPIIQLKVCKTDRIVYEDTTADSIAFATDLPEFTDQRYIHIGFNKIIIRNFNILAKVLNLCTAIAFEDLLCF